MVFLWTRRFINASQESSAFLEYQIDVNRRNFLARIVAFFSLGITSLMATPLVRFISGSLKEKPEEGWYAILDVSDLRPGEVVQVQYNRLLRDGWMTAMAQETVFVSKTKEGACLVFDPHCTHLGCAISWNSEAKQFQCPCHGGKFEANGSRIAGPPPRPLRQYQAKVENNILKIGNLKA